MALMKYPGIGEEELLSIQAQQVASNYYFGRFSCASLKSKKPMTKMLLVDTIYNKHMLQYTRNSIKTKIEELIYIDRALIKTKLGNRQYIELSEKGRRIAELALEWHEMSIPPPPGA